MFFASFCSFLSLSRIQIFSSWLFPASVSVLCSGWQIGTNSSYFKSFSFSYFFPKCPKKKYRVLMLTRYVSLCVVTPFYRKLTSVLNDGANLVTKCDVEKWWNIRTLCVAAAYVTVRFTATHWQYLWLSPSPWSIQTPATNTAWKRVNFEKTMLPACMPQLVTSETVG